MSAGEALCTRNVNVTSPPGSGTEVGEATLSIVMLDGFRVFVIVHVLRSPYAIEPSLQSAEYDAA